VLAMAIAAADRKGRRQAWPGPVAVNEEDPSLTMIQNPRTHDICCGEGEMHLRAPLERLRDRFGVNVKSQPPASDIRRPFANRLPQRGRHKKQSGGPRPVRATWCWRSSRCRAAAASSFTKGSFGARFAKLYRAVEEGVVRWVLRGPLGFPVIDVQ